MKVLEVSRIKPRANLRAVELQLQTNKVQSDVVGFGVVVSSQGKPLGTISDGDIRRTIAHHVGDLSLITAEEIMNRDFQSITIGKSELKKGIVNFSSDQFKAGKNFRYLVAIYPDGIFAGLIDIQNLDSDLSADQMNFDEVEIFLFGLGFVGLTLGLIIADSGLVVKCIEPSAQRCQELKSPDLLDIYEPGIKELLKEHLGKNLVVDSNLSKFTQRQPARQLKKNSPRIYIVAVGSPIRLGTPDLSQVEEVAKCIGSDITYGDLVIVRTTLPIGTTRKVVARLISVNSGLEPGQDFFLAFAPERTIEGNALAELKNLPQIIGGISDHCTSLASRLFIKFAPVIISVSNPETAEMVKLANNAYRDVIFGFSNELAEIAAKNNVDSLEMIQAANTGYSRSNIQRPSVGVGGACLTKDSYLLLANENLQNHVPSLILAAREINELSVNRYAKRVLQIDGKDDSEGIILVLGTAFKGTPPNRDERYSPSLELIKILTDAGKRVIVWDPEILSRQDMSLNDPKTISRVRAVVVMTNHPGNAKFLEGLINKFQKVVQIRNLFDPWEIIDWNLVKKQIDNRQTFPCEIT